MSKGDININMFPDEVIALNRELASGLHPALEKKLSDLSAEHLLLERLGIIAEHVDLVLDGAYGPDDIANICGIIYTRLIAKRENPNKGIIIIH